MIRQVWPVRWHFCNKGFAARRLPQVEVPDYGRGDRGLSMRAVTLAACSIIKAAAIFRRYRQGSGDASDAAIIADLRRAAQQVAGPVGCMWPVMARRVG